MNNVASGYSVSRHQGIANVPMRQFGCSFLTDRDQSANPKHSDASENRACSSDMRTAMTVATHISASRTLLSQTTASAFDCKKFRLDAASKASGTALTVAHQELSQKDCYVDAPMGLNIRKVPIYAVVSDLRPDISLDLYYD